MSVTFFERAARPQQALKVTPFRDVSLPDGTAWSSFYCCGADYLVRFPGLADFEISGDGLEVQG